MNPMMMALGVASIMLCIGMILRAKILFLRKMLVPVCVIAGVVGFVFMNVVLGLFNLQLDGMDARMFTEIVDVLFTISFISIGLTEVKKDKKDSGTGMGYMRGALGMGMVWCALYMITPVIGYVVISLIGKPFGMRGEYGMLIPFAFCQGPGQAANYGLIFEKTYGLPGSPQVAITFAVIGFLVAFLVGVPIAKMGLKKMRSREEEKLDTSVERGFYSLEEQMESMGNVTTHSGSIETLAFHFALIGACYILAVVLSKLVYHVPIFGPTISGMMFFCGMIAAYIVNAIMNRFDISFLKDNVLQSKITGWTSDFLVVSAFMAVEVKAVGSWIIPILVESVVVTAVTAVMCIFFGKRFGGENDFERILGLFGTSTGTMPSGMALIRMVDANLVTSTVVELGMMNLTMVLSTPGMVFLTLGMTNIISLPICCIGMTIVGILFLLLLKPMSAFNEPTFTFSNGRVEKESTV